MVSIILLVCCLGIFVYGIMYAFRLQYKRQNITRFDILEPFKSMSAFKAELKFLLPIFIALYIISYLFGDYKVLGMSLPVFIVVAKRRWRETKARGAETSNSSNFGQWILE